MNLEIENGELELPRDFSFELERTNPFLSNEGDATIPATLPSSDRNLQLFNHIERLDRMGDNMVDIPAVLRVGSFVKNGRLIVDTAHRRDGINVSFAIENSSLYCRYKDKTVKQIFAEYNNGAGLQDYTYVGLANIVSHLEDIYNANAASVDYTIFPVGVSKYDDDGTEVYQVNNAFSGGTLIYQTRVVREGDVQMTVPNGYGVSPFIYLWVMLRRMFALMGYSVAYNVFTFGWLRNVVVLNNCSDTIVNGVIKYEDMVPSCKVSELLQWLKDKFHVHVRIDSNDKNVYIVPMESLLEGNADADWSDRLEGDPTLTFNKTSRTVLSSRTTIAGAAPAAETFDALIEKYGGFFPINESQYYNMKGGTFQYHDCLVFRYATGEFFEIRTNLNTAKDELIRLGTNYFKYDRSNSDESENFEAYDEIPPMVVADKFFVPYIGERTHAHTTFNDSKTDTEQPIILVQQAYIGPNSYYQKRLGTTQGCLPLSDNSGWYLAGTLVNYQCWTINGQTPPVSMYEHCWAEYNKQLRNGLVEIAANLLLKATDLSGLDMTKPKLLRNQKLLPKSFNIPISEKMGLSACQFLLIKDNASLVEDSAVTYNTPARIRWVFTGSEAISDLWATIVNTSYHHYNDMYGSPYNGLLYDQYLTLIEPGGPMPTIAYIAKPTGEYELEFTDGIEKLYAHTPAAVGETSPQAIRYFTLKIQMGRHVYDTSVPNNYGTFHDNFYIDFEGQSAPVTYTSQAY